MNSTNNNKGHIIENVMKEAAAKHIEKVPNKEVTSYCNTLAIQLSNNCYFRTECFKNIRVKPGFNMVEYDISQGVVVADMIAIAQCLVEISNLMPEFVQNRV